MSLTTKKKLETNQIPEGFACSLDVLPNNSLPARDLFKIFNGPEKELPVELPPSMYIIELKRSHEERQTLLRRLQTLERNKEFKGELEIIPNVIVFQNWHVEGSFLVKFTISNRLKNPLDLNVICEPSPYFSMVSQTTRRCKLANGITTPFSVVFLPNAPRDYHHKITIMTSFSKIIVPVIAIGPRPILDFPDKVDFGETPVKVFITRVLMICNVGNAQAAASLIAESPFDVSPKYIYLLPSESTAVKVIFCSRNPGLFFGSLKVYHDNGDELVVKLVGIAGNAKVWLEKESLEFVDTFVSTRIEHGVKIFNDTDHVLSFKWVKNPSPSDDMNVVLHMQHTDASIQSRQTGLAVDYYASDHPHRMIMDHVHLDGAKQIQHGDLFFRHNNFDIIPLVGAVNPHSEHTITILFEPTEDKKYSTKAYCDVEGADRRLPLDLLGTGLGPDIHVNVDVIDFDLIFLKLEHTYELLFTNLGLIKGRIQFREPKLLYGGNVASYPDQLVLSPAGSQFLCIKFFSSTIGSFVEEMFFDVVGSNKAIRVIIKGKVVSPLVTFDRTYLDFGSIAFGFPISQTLRIENKSPIPATFKAVVPDDGDQPSMPVWKFGDKLTSLKSSASYKVVQGKHPQEFQITPSSGVLIPHGSIYLEITLTPNIARECFTTLQIWLRDIEYEELTIPVHFIACQAKLTASPSIIVHRYAFIGYPYAFDLTLENEGETPLFFFSDSQPESDESDEGSGIRYSLAEDYGIINGNSTTRLLLTVIVSRLGKMEQIVFLNIFGQPRPLSMCTVIAYGIGPSVTAEPYSLSWKNQPIGTLSPKELTLRNISPVPAEWSLRIEKDYSGGYCDPKPWTLSQDEGILQPYSDILIEVTASLIDTTRIVADLILDVTNSTSTNIKLVGKGTGTSILFEPPLMDSWDFGDVFINELFTFPIRVKNIGTLHHRVIFTQKTLKSSDMASNKAKRLPLEFSPDRIDLEGCENKDMEILLHHDVVGQCTVDFYIYATINRKGRRILIGKSTLRANFIFPLLVVEPRVLNMFFRLENLTMELPTYITADVSVRTTTLMPIETVATVKLPFTLVSKNGDHESLLVFQATKQPILSRVQLDLFSMDEEQMKNTAGLLTFTVMSKYKTRVPIKAAVLFPYLSTNESEVHLGSSEPYVALYSMLQLKNKGNLLVNFRWKLVVNSFKYIDVMCPEISHILESEEMKKAMTKLDVLPEWVPNQDESGTAEDAAPLGSTKISNRYGILSILKSGNQLTVKPSSKEQDVFEINAHAIVTALVPFLNNTVLPALITAEKGNLPPLPQFDTKSWDLDLVPAYGNSPPQYENITNAFAEPDRLGVFVGDAICEVQNGLSETITFMGASGPPFYRLEPEIIDFGVRKFCELWFTSFKIINTGWTSFYYEINIMYKDHLFEYSMQPRCFAIQPASKLIESGEEVVVGVTFYPAVTGPIKKHFLLSIGSAPPIEVEIKGFASCPQILINCPLDQCCSVPKEILYSAIGRQLCNEWFCPLFTEATELTDPVLKTVEGFQDQHVCLEIPGPASHLQDFLYPFEEGWVIVTSNHFVPSSLDVTSAIERELCHDYYHYLRPKMLRHTMRHYAGEIKKEKSFPYFTLPGYKMVYFENRNKANSPMKFNVQDLGPIIIGSEKHYDLEIMNPGPLEVDLKIRLPFRNKAHLAKKGITFDEVESAHLQPGESLKLKCDVCPSHKLYKNLDADCSIEFVFHIEVACGGKIPLQFSTTITYPYLNMKKKIVFGQLKCGQKKLVHFLIKNSGLVPVSWQCHQRNVRKRPIKGSEYLSDAESPFNFSPSEGFLDPHSYQFITVEFLPTSEGKFEKVLEFNILNREQPQQVRLVGTAVEPKVDITFQDMDFGSIVPFSLAAFKEITATNNTTEPLEVFFPEYDYALTDIARFDERKQPANDCGCPSNDSMRYITELVMGYFGIGTEKSSDICEEEKIFSMLCQYYGVPNMFVPAWCYDTCMTADLKNIYYQKLGALAEDFYRTLQDSKSRSRDLTQSKMSKRTTSRSSDPASRPTLDGSPKTKKSKIKKKQRVSAPDFKREVLVKADKTVKKDEIKEMLVEPSLDEKISIYLNYLQSNPDISRRDLFQPLEESSPSEDEKPNKLIFFGGGPYTNYKYWAKYMARQTKLLYMSIDELILYAASLSQYGSAAAVRKVVNNVYCKVVMGLEPAEHALLDQFDPLSGIQDTLLDLLTKMTAIERTIEESLEEARKAKRELAVRSAVSSKRTHTSNKSRKSLKRKSQTPGSKRQSEKASKSSGPGKSKSGGPRNSKSATKRQSKTGSARRQSVKSQKSQRSVKSLKPTKKEDHAAEKMKRPITGAHLLLDLDKPVLEDLPVDMLLELIKDFLVYYANYPGVVLDYMRGFFIRDSVLAMTTVLKAVFNKKIDLRCIDLNTSYAFYQTIMENRRRDEEKRLAEELERKMNEIDKLDGFKFRDIDEESKLFYIEEVNKRDEVIASLSLLGTPVVNNHKQQASSKVGTPSSQPPTSSSTGNSGKTKAGTAGTPKAGLTYADIDEGLARKNPSVEAYEVYISRLDALDDTSMDEEMFFLYLTYGKEMQAILNILENWDSKYPFWEKSTKKSDDEKKTKKKPKPDDTKGTDKAKKVSSNDAILKDSNYRGKLGIPCYVLHTVPWGLEKELQPLMSYTVTRPEFQGTPAVINPWDDVEIPEPVTYFWIMQPLYGISGEDAEVTNLKSIEDRPEDTKTPELQEVDQMSVGGSSDKKTSYLITKESDPTSETDDVQSSNGEQGQEEEVNENREDDAEEQEPARRHQNADPLMVGLLHTSNQANEQKSLDLLRNEFIRIEPSLHRDLLNPMIDELYKINMKQYEDTQSRKSRLLSKASIKPRRSGASAVSPVATASNEDSEEIEKLSIHELVESQQFHIYGVSLATGAESSGPGVRVLLNPGEAATWRVTCSTRMCGAFERKFLMEVGGWQKSLQSITCHVVSGIPSFDRDPNVVYCSVSEKQPAQRPTYFLGKKVFDFGPVLNSKTQSDPRLFQVMSEFRIVNNSGVVIEEMALINNDYEPSPHFTFEPSEFNGVMPGEVKIMRGYAHPIAHGNQEATFWYYVKNNPLMGFLHFRCQGIGGKISYTAEDFTENKVLLLRKVKRTLRLQNTGTGLSWEIANVVELSSRGVKLSPSKGMLRKNESAEVDVVYRPMKPGMLSEKLKLAVYNWDKKGSPIQMEEISFNVEGVDIAVTLLYKWRSTQRPGFTTKDHLDCGRANVGETVPRSFFIVSLCPDEFLFEIVYRKKINCEIECVPETGRLSHGKNMQIDVNVTVTCPVKIKREPVMDLKLLYMQNNELELVAMVPIQLSIFCKNSQFSFFPSPELDFGVVEVNSFQERKIVFENLGDAPLDLAIMTTKQLQILVEQIAEAKREEREFLRDKRKERSPKATSGRTSKRATKGSSGRAPKRASKASPRRASKRASKAGSRRASKRASRSTTKRASKTGSKQVSKGSFKKQSSSKTRTYPRSLHDRLWFIDKKPLEIGAFSLSANGITISPYGQDFVSVSCTLKTLGQTEETVLICSPDIIRDHPEKGVFYPLRAVSAVPNVDLSNPRILYPEMVIVSNEDVLDTSEGEPIGIYNTDMNTITFYNVALGQLFSRYIVLTNVGFIDAAVQVSIEEHPSAVNKENAFGLSDDLSKRNTVVYIQRFGHQSFHLYFSPSALQMVRGVMKFSLITNIPGYSLTHQVYLEGKGDLPEIKVLKPPMADEVMTSTLDFGSCPLDFAQKRQLTFKNVGAIVCTVLVEIIGARPGSSHTKNPFSVKVNEEVKNKYLRGPDTNAQPLGLTNKFVVPRGHEVELDVLFTPTCVNEVEGSTLILHAVYNPYVIKTVVMTGAGSSDWLSIRGIPLVGSKEDESLSEGKGKKSGLKRQSMAAKRRSTAGHKRDRTVSVPGSPLAEKIKTPSFPRLGVYHEIDFGTVPTGIVHSFSFELINSSIEPCKFSWDSHPHVRIIPGEGHILPKMSKKCYAVFTSDEPVEAMSEGLKCTIYSIVYDEVQTSQWDNDKKMVQWISSLVDVSEITTQEFLKKKEFPCPEPSHKRSTSEEEKSIVVYVKGRCEVPDVTLSTASITMNTAFLYQKEETVAEVTNGGNMPAEYTWNVRTTDVASVPELFGCDPKVSTGPLGEGEYPGILPSGVEVPITPRMPQKKLPNRPGYIYEPTPIKGTVALRSQMVVKPSLVSCINQPISQDLNLHSNVFFVTPRQGVIPANGSSSFKFTFIPPNTLKYFADAILQIKGIPEPMVISLSGIGQMSSCHVEIAPSDYLTAGRRSPNIVPYYDYDPNTSVIEIRVMGIGIICRKRFTVMNPTQQDYHYQWRLEHISSDSDPDVDSKCRNPPFLCCTKFGLLPAKQKQQMLFEFRPKRAGTTESFWTLEIQELQLNHTFLIVGIVTEPKVLIKPQILQLRPTLKGVKSSGDAFIENNEDFPITYSIETKSLMCVNDGKGLEAEPFTGSVDPHGSQLVRFTHVPNRAGEETFLVRCDVKRRAQPLELTVRTVCYQVELAIKYRYKNETGTLHSFFPNTIKLGRLYERIPCNVEFTFTNTGTPPWYFHCEPDENINKLNDVNMSLSACSGLVLSKDSKAISLSITAKKKNSFSDIPFTIKITKGPDYNILFCGTAAMPEYEFSFLTHNFGPKILLNKYDRAAYCVDLQVTNMDDEAIVLAKSSDDPEFLHVDLLSCVVQPRSRITVPIAFIPLTTGELKATVCFVVNDVKEETVMIKGEGVKLDIQLKNGKDETLDFGIVEVNKTVRREVEIINNTQSAVAVRLEMSGSDKFIAIVLPKTFDMLPNSAIRFEVSLTPKKRGASYNGDVTLYHGDYKQTLLTMTCVGGGYDLSLNRQHVPFPAVIIGSSVVEHVCLVNQGEYPARYEWKMDSLIGQLFSIAPQQGYSNPGSSIPFEITFYPTKLFKSITTEVRCMLSNGQALSIKLSGACLELPPPQEVIEFKTPVRKELMKLITLENKTYTPWTLFPVMSGKYYSGVDRVEINPNGKFDYEVEYYPLLSTNEDKKHTGSAFFSFPDGRSVLYAFLGETTPPEEEATLLWTAIAKEETPKSLEVENRLYEPQRMKVTFSRTDNENPEAFIIQGPEYIDLPPKSRKTYEVGLYALHEGVSRWKIEMVNEVLNEILWYSLTLNVGGIKILEKFTMETNLRVPVFKNLTLENPLTKPADVSFKSPTPTLRMLNNSPIIIPATEEVTIQLVYLPLVFPHEYTEQESVNFGEEMDDVFSETHRLEFKSPQLGSFHFDVVLVAHPELMEPPIYVEAHVSSPTVFGVPIKVFSSARTSFDFQSNFQDIWLLTDEVERLPDEQSLLAKCIYSPSQLGKFNCHITFFSPETGTFRFPVVATGLSPKPMGPILFETGQRKSIAFQNIFPENQTFSVKRTNTAFELDSEYFSLDPNEIKLITVTMVWAQQQLGENDIIEPFPIATQLTIVPESPPRPGIIWIFYLKGTNKDLSEIVEGEGQESEIE